MSVFRRAGIISAFIKPSWLICPLFVGILVAYIVRMKHVDDAKEKKSERDYDHQLKHMKAVQNLYKSGVPPEQLSLPTQAALPAPQPSDTKGASKNTKRKPT